MIGAETQKRTALLRRRILALIARSMYDILSVPHVQAMSSLWRRFISLRSRLFFIFAADFFFFGAMVMKELLLETANCNPADFSTLHNGLFSFWCTRK